MKSILQTTGQALVLFVLLTLITGVAYPLLMTGVGRVAFPFQAGGSLLERDGKPVGSALIGQSFSGPKYFWSRPSATSPMSNNATSSSGSNLGPLNPALVDAVKGRVDTLQKASGNTSVVPVDLVTASASGLDPDISPAGAVYQIERVAHARNMTADAVRALVDANTEGRQLGFLGMPRVNVLRLNLALDAREVAHTATPGS